MKYLFFIASILILSKISLFSQENTSKLIDNDKKKFEESVFNKEFGEVEDTADHARKLYDKIPDKLPDWVFTPVEIGDKIRLVGFSDPNMNRKLAYKQAIVRAKSVFALLNTAMVSNITDDYTNLKESGKYALYATKFQDFALSKTKFAYQNESVHVIDTFYTKYNEGIVLIEFDYEQDNKLNKDTLIVKGEHLQVFIERNFQKERVEFFNLFIQDMVARDSIDLFAQYNYKIVNRSYDISSYFEDDSIKFEDRTYNYRSDLNFKLDSTDSELQFFSLNKGLWNAYLTGILKNITVLSKQLSSKVKNSNDFYTIKSEGLIRTVARNKVSFDLYDFKMIENQFYVDLNGLIIQ